VSASLLWQGACYLTYVFGQFLFLLKRAWSSKRNQATAVVTVGDYFRESSVPIFIRVCLEGVLYFGLLHYHVALAYLFNLWGWNLPKGFDISQFVNPILTLPAGYAVDSMVDAFAVSNKVPGWLRTWIAENVPQLPAGVKLQQALDKAADAAADSKQAAKVTEIAIAKVQDIAPKQ
jgi:hypothetical protein